MVTLAAFSSVARGEGGGGGLEPPIGLKSMQKSPFLGLLRPIFALKIKTAFQRDSSAEVVKDMPSFGPEQ